LVDSGCDITTVPKSLTDRFKYLESQPSLQHIWAANNIAIQIEGETELPFELDGRCLWTPVLISEDAEEVMLGIDWLECHKRVSDFNTKRLTIDGLETVTLRCKGHLRCQRVLAQEYQEIPQQSQKDIMARDQPNSREKMHDFTAEFLKCVKFHGKFTEKVLQIHGPHIRYFEVLRYC